jgi:membrane-bound metal-dependent hydrolase YbcI (DUF457 family)
MPQAVAHILVVLILLELFRAYLVKDKDKFPRHYILIGGIAAILPDIDMALFYLLSFFNFTIQEVHRVFLHNIFLPLIFLGLALIFIKFKSEKLGKMHLKLSKIFLIIAFGIAIHLVLDVLFSGTIEPFWPLSSLHFGINLAGYVPSSWHETFMASIDAGLFIIWIAYLELNHKIKSFI